MRLLFDTHTLLWTVEGTIPKVARDLLEDTANTMLFSTVNIWEIELKRNRLGVDSSALYQNLISNGVVELPVTSEHVFRLAKLPNIHKDPFDRILIAQAMSERAFLLTADKTIKQYSKFLDCIMGFEA